MRVSNFNILIGIIAFGSMMPLPAQTTCTPDAVQTWLEANAFGYLEVAEVTATPQEQPQGKDKKRVKKTVRQEAPAHLYHTLMNLVTPNM